MQFSFKCRIFVLLTNNIKMRSFKDEERFRIAKEEYLSGDISITKLCKKYNMCRYRITQYIKKLGIEITNEHNATKFDDTVFDIIDTEEKAYWLGFIYADGYVSKRDNSFELSLCPKDIGHLKKFGRFLQYEENVKLRDYRCRFIIANKHFHQVLVKNGIVPQKTTILEFPSEEIVPKELIRHFIRGYFDGDGHISHTNARKNNRILYNVELISTEQFLKQVLEICNIKSNLRLANKNGNKKVKLFSLAMNSGYKLLTYMYEDATIYLDRKYERFNKFAVLARNSKYYNGRIKQGRCDSQLEPKAIISKE